MTPAGRLDVPKPAGRHEPKRSHPRYLVRKPLPKRTLQNRVREPVRTTVPTPAMLVTVEDGRALEVRGDPEHQFTRGALCVKVNDYVERVTAQSASCIRCGASAKERSSSGSDGTRRWTRSRAASKQSSPSTARRRSCPAAILGPRACSAPQRRRRVLQPARRVD